MTLDHPKIRNGSWTILLPTDGTDLKDLNTKSVGALVIPPGNPTQTAIS